MVIDELFHFRKTWRNVNFWTGHASLKTCKNYYYLAPCFIWLVLFCFACRLDAVRPDTLREMIFFFKCEMLCFLNVGNKPSIIFKILKRPTQAKWERSAGWIWTNGDSLITNILPFFPHVILYIKHCSSSGQRGLTSQAFLASVNIIYN